MQSGMYLSCPRCLAPFRAMLPRCPADGTELHRSDSDPLVGMELDGRYRLDALLGEGGIGRVYRARHLRLSRTCAIKIPFGELLGDEAIRERLVNEAEAASRANHPNLVAVLDAGETCAGLFYLVMELVEGRSLTSIIDEGAMSPERALGLTAQIADGLDHAHAGWLVHRDLKPDNILVEDRDGAERVRIVDFGIALLQDQSRSRLTAKGMVVGTPEYMAPEQLAGLAVDARTDLFALGQILYEMIAGAAWVQGKPLEVATAHLSQDTPRLSEMVPDRAIDQRVDTLIRWLTARRRGERPSGAAEVAKHARAILAYPAIKAEVRPPQRAASPGLPLAVPPTRRPVSHERRWLLVGAFGAAMLIANIVYDCSCREPRAGTGTEPTALEWNRDRSR